MNPTYRHQQVQLSSNRNRNLQHSISSPPNCLYTEKDICNDKVVTTSNKRSIFSSPTKKKYNVLRESRIPHNGHTHDMMIPSQTEDINLFINRPLSTPPRTPNDDNGNTNHPPLNSVGYQNSFLSSNLSPLTPAQLNNNKNDSGTTRYVPSRLMNMCDENDEDDSIYRHNEKRFVPWIQLGSSYICIVSPIFSFDWICIGYCFK